MKVTIAFILSVIATYSIAQNPFSSIGKEAEVLSLTNGKYDEVHENDSLVRIGSVIYDTRINKIAYFVEEEVLQSEATMEPTVVSRWLSRDPLASKFPYYSPYQFAGNKPIVAIDIDGLEDIWVHNIEQEDGTVVQVGKASVIGDKNSPTRGELNAIFNHGGKPFPLHGMLSTVKKKNGTTDVNFTKTEEAPTVIGKKTFSFGVDEDKEEFWKIKPKYGEEENKEMAKSAAEELGWNLALFKELPLTYDPADKLNRTLKREIKARLRSNGTGSTAIVPLYNDNVNNKEIKGIYFIQYNENEKGEGSFTEHFVPLEKQKTSSDDDTSF